MTACRGQTSAQAEPSFPSFRSRHRSHLMMRGMALSHWNLGTLYGQEIWQ